MASDPNDRLLEQGLEQWRGQRLQSIADHMIELSRDYRSAQDGLGIAHRNPGEVRQDIIDYQWDKLNHSATELEQLERKHRELMEMDLPHLVVEYKQKRKERHKWVSVRY